MQLLFKNVNYLKIVSKIKSGGILTLVTLGTRSLRTGFKCVLKTLGASASPQNAHPCPGTQARREAVVALNSSLASASSSECR